MVSTEVQGLDSLILARDVLNELWTKRAQIEEISGLMGSIRPPTVPSTGQKSPAVKEITEAIEEIKKSVVGPGGEKLTDFLRGMDDKINKINAGGAAAKHALLNVDERAKMAVQKAFIEKINQFNFVEWSASHTEMMSKVGGAKKSFPGESPGERKAYFLELVAAFQAFVKTMTEQNIAIPERLVPQSFLNKLILSIGARKGEEGYWGSFAGTLNEIMKKVTTETADVANRYEDLMTKHLKEKGIEKKGDILEREVPIRPVKSRLWYKGKSGTRYTSREEIMGLLGEYRNIGEGAGETNRGIEIREMLDKKLKYERESLVDEPVVQAYVEILGKTFEQVAGGGPHTYFAKQGRRIDFLTKVKKEQVETFLEAHEKTLREMSRIGKEEESPKSIKRSVEIFRAALETMGSRGFEAKRGKNATQKEIDTDTFQRFLAGEANYAEFEKRVEEIIGDKSIQLSDIIPVIGAGSSLNLSGVPISSFVDNVVNALKEFLPGTEAKESMDAAFKKNVLEGINVLKDLIGNLDEKQIKKIEKLDEVEKALKTKESRRKETGVKEK